MKYKLSKDSIRKWALPVLFLLVACTFAIGSSPVYRTNPWVDSNAMLTMGKAMLHGYVPFKDIIDQRGPVLYALFAFGASIRGNSFSGVFIVQVINVVIVYILTWKVAELFKIKVIDSKWIALIGPTILLSTSAFSFSGSPEEFAFTSILYLLLVVNRAKQNIDNISLKSFFFLGINLSLVFWNKFSMTGAFVAFFAWTACFFIYKKDFRKLLKVILSSFLGFSIISIVVFIYFSINNAVGDLIKIYFVQNLTSYGQSNQTGLMKVWNLLFLLGQEMHDHMIVAVLIVAGWIKAIYDKQHITLEVTLFLGTILFVALQHWLNEYYNLVWISFLVVAVLRLLNFELPKIENKDSLFVPAKIILVVILMLLPFANNKDLNNLVIRGESTSFNHYHYAAQPHFANIMLQKEKKPSLLMANDLDDGFYLAANILPTTRYWQKLNMTYQQLPRMYNSFDYTLRNKKVDFVIVRLAGMPVPDHDDLINQISNSVDSHLRHQLFENYQIESVSQNSMNDSYVLMYKK